MKKLPEELKILMKISERLNVLMDDAYTKVEIRSGELFEFSIKNKYLASKFNSKKDFNSFLRRQYDNGQLMQIIPNCRVDTSLKHSYKWFFRKKTVNKKNKNAIALNGNYIHYKDSLAIQTSDNTQVRSEQEKFIYESLLQQKNIFFVYDYPLIIDGKKKIVDFYIKNKIDNTDYYWEHFGVTGDKGYLDKIPDILRWYKSVNIKDISEDDGNLILTYFRDLESFQKEVSKNILKITESETITKNVNNVDTKLPVVDAYILVNLNDDDKGSYSMMLKFSNEKVQYKRSFTKNFKHVHYKRILSFALRDAILKLKKSCYVNFYFSVDDFKLIFSEISEIQLKNKLTTKHRHEIKFQFMDEIFDDLNFQEAQQNLIESF